MCTRNSSNGINFVPFRAGVRSSDDDSNEIYDRRLSFVVFEAYFMYLMTFELVANNLFYTLLQLTHVPRRMADFQSDSVATHI